MGQTETKPETTGLVQYDVTIYTGEKKQNGTDGSAYIQLYGDKGVSPEFRLHHNSKDDFRKGHVDTHPVICQDIGELWKIELWKVDAKDKQSRWFVNRIVIDFHDRPQPKKQKKSKKLKNEVQSQKYLNISKSGPAPLGTRTRARSVGSFDDDWRQASSETPTALSDEESYTDKSEVDSQTLSTGATDNQTPITHNTKWTFPIFRWISTREEIWEGTTMLPQMETNEERIRQRQIETERKRGIYQWKCEPDLPSYMRTKFADLPPDERWSEEKLGDFLSSRFKAGANFALDKVLEKFKQWKDFDDYKELFNILPVPKLQRNWLEDKTFGQLRLTGVNPVLIRRVLNRNFQKNFLITDELLKPLLRPGSTLISEIENNRFYYTEFSEFAEYTKEDFKEGRYMTCPVCLFYLNENDQLVPIAIQLRCDIPTNNTTNPIFTSLDSEEEWLMAKMFVANADAVSHQIVSHLLHTHLVSEPYLIALHRNLPSCHPLYKLMLPHFKYQLAINCKARELLLARDGPVDMVMPLKIDKVYSHVRKRYVEWRFDESSLPALIQVRDIPVPRPQVINPTWEATETPETDSAREILPRYFYRDDGIEVWTAIKNFIGNVIELFYRDDIDVQNDFELQAWAAEVYDVGFSKKDKGFPRQIGGISQLVEVLTTMVWTVSGQHAAVNFQQYDNFGFIPANPGSLFTMPFGMEGSSWQRGKLTYDDIFKALPPKVVCSRQIAITWLLSQYSEEDQSLGKYPETMFNDVEFDAEVRKFKMELRKIHEYIEDRNKSFVLKGEDEYDQLLPTKIPNATAM